MSRKQRTVSILLLGCIIVILLVGIFLLRGSTQETESIREAMRNEVLHESHRINFLGIKQVNPGLISAFVVTGVFFVFSLCMRIFVIQKFQYIPGKFQLLLEQAVGMFDNLAKSNSPHRNRFLGAYVFTAGAYIFVGTLFELLGLQAVSADGMSVTLPAPLADINGAIALGCLSYGVILGGGLLANGIKGVGKTLKDFSLPVSMSFRLFGALLSGALVTELVYYYTQLSFVLPVIVGVLFTLLHALIQAYVLTMLTALFYGEVTEKPKPKQKLQDKNENGKILQSSQR